MERRSKLNNKGEKDLTDTVETLSEARLLSLLKDYEYDGIRSLGQAGINGRGSSTVLEVPPIGFTLYKGAPSNSFKEILATIWLRARIVSIFGHIY